MQTIFFKKIKKNCNWKNKNINNHIYFIYTKTMGLCSISLLHAFVICLGSMLMGHVGAYTSPTGQKIREEHHLSDQDFKWSFYCSISFLAAAFGPFVSKFLLNIFKGKRKNTMFVIGAISVVAWLLNCLTKINIYAGWMARALLGITVGSFSSVTAMFLVEIAPKGLSGFYGSLNTIAVFFAQSIISFLGPFVDYIEYNYLSAAVSAALCISIWFIPESPLVASSPINEAPKKVPICRKRHSKGLFIGITIMFLQQFSGINGILANLTDIFREAGLDLNPNYQSGISLIILLFGNILGSFMIDKIGQRNQWFITTSLSFIGCFMMALNDKFKWSNILPLICIFTYNFGFGLGLGSIPWFLVFDLFDEQVREIGNTICVVSNWSFAFIIVMLFPSMKESLGMFGVMMLFAAVCFIAIIFGIFFVHNAIKNEGEEVENLDSAESSYADFSLNNEDKPNQ